MKEGGEDFDGINGIFLNLRNWGESFARRTAEARRAEEGKAEGFRKAWSVLTDGRKV
jgi:hypothetical protein